MHICNFRAVEIWIFLIRHPSQVARLQHHFLGTLEVDKRDLGISKGEGANLVLGRKNLPLSP